MSSFSNNAKEFKGIIQRKICAICKLHFRKDQEIMQCKSCSSLFHQEHLLNWISENEDCPVCQSLIVHITKNTDNNQMESIDRSMNYANRIKNKRIIPMKKLDIRLTIAFIVVIILLIVLALILLTIL